MTEDRFSKTPLPCPRVELEDVWPDYDIEADTSERWQAVKFYLLCLVAGVIVVGLPMSLVCLVGAAWTFIGLCCVGIGFCLWMAWADGGG